jgi:two-component system response regulator YesN
MFKVFLVDDEPFIIEGLYDLVKWPDYGMEIVGHAINGALALEAMEGLDLDILITDISMPVMGGLSLIPQAQKRYPDLKVIILSGYNEFDYLKEGMRLGIENYLLKPINIVEMKATLANVAAKLNEGRTDKLLQEYGMDVMRENTLYRYITGQIEPQEFSERAGMMGFDLEQPYVLVAVVASLQPVQQVMDKLTELIRPLSERGRLYLFKDREGYLVLLWTLGDAEGERALAVQQARDWSHILAEQGGAVQIALGGAVQHPGEAKESYLQAQRALEYFVLYPDETVIDSRELPASESRQMPPYINWDEYTKLIMAKDADELTARIANDYKKLQAESGMTPEALRSITVELLIRFKMELQAIKKTKEPELIRNHLQRVYNAAAIGQLAELVMDTAARTVESLTSDLKSPVIQQVLLHVQEAYASDLSLKLLGAQYHIHPVYLGQLFHRETGETFTDYINHYRIEKSKELLRTTHLKVHEIARQVGYWETGYFYKQFKKHVGISPTDYKGML